MTTSKPFKLFSSSSSANKAQPQATTKTREPPAVEAQVEKQSNHEDPDSHSDSDKASKAKASDHMLTPGSRKRSIFLNLVLPPEAPAVDAHLTLPPMLFPPSLPLDHDEVHTTISTRSIPVSESKNGSSSKETVIATKTEETTTTRSLRSWVWGGQQLTKRGNKQVSANVGQNNKQDKVVQGLAVVETETVVSKTTQIRAWMSKMGRSESEDHINSKNTADVVSTVATHQRHPAEGHHQKVANLQATSSSQGLDGSLITVQEKQQVVHECNHSHSGQQEVTTETTTTTHQKRSVSVVSVNVNVSDIFGLGKVMEMILALFHAHGAFLRRQPFWLQTTVLGWEALVVLLLLWGVLRIVGLAEVVVWGADDLVRGTLSTIQLLGRSLQTYFSS